MSAPLEMYVYDKLGRRIGLILTPLFFLPIIAVAGGIYSTAPAGHRDIPAELVGMLVFLTAFSLIMGIMVNIAMSLRVRVDPGKGKVFRIYTLLGRVVRRTEFPLSQFDRISLHRAYRGGYLATLIGREREVIIGVSSNLGRVRKAAEEAAACCNLPLKDQL